jgi:acetyl esterase
MANLDPKLKALLDRMAGMTPRIDWRGNVEKLREQFWRTTQRLERDAPNLAEIRALSVPGATGPLKARLYVPLGAGPPPGPGVVFFHGGGFVVGDLDSHEMLCRRLAEAARARVLSVEYRLAPEHRFPAAVEDCAAAAKWAFAAAAQLGFDPARIGLAGDSAGGNLAAVTAQGFKRAGDQRLKAQLLIYPCTQFVLMTPSQLRLKEGYMLTQAAQDFFKDTYLSRREDAYDVRASPLLENDLGGLPPAMVVTAGFDPLLDEGKAYAEKLAACGVPTVLKSYPSQVHGFFNMTAVSRSAKQAIEACGTWLGETLRR